MRVYQAACCIKTNENVLILKRNSNRPSSEEGESMMEVGKEVGEEEDATSRFCQELLNARDQYTYIAGAKARDTVDTYGTDPSIQSRVFCLYSPSGLGVAKLFSDQTRSDQMQCEMSLLRMDGLKHHILILEIEIEFNRSKL
jgi:hypothetical protein